MASILKVDKLDPQSGTALEIGSSGDTITIPSGATFTQSGTMNASAITAGTIATARLGSGTASSSTVLYGDQTYEAEPGGDNTPIFASTLTTTQSVAYATWTKLLFATEVFDVGGDYDATNSKFVCSTDGKYLFHYTCRMDVTASASQGNWINAGLYKNASREEQSVLISSATLGDVLTQDVGISGVFILDLSASDYVEVYSRHGSDGAGAQNYDAVYQSFQGFKLIT